MPLQLINLLDIEANQAAWDADLQTNIDALKAALRVLKMEIFTQGNIATPSVIKIQLQDANGDPLAEQFNLRVRVADAAGYANATNATIAAAGGSTLLESLTATKDIVIKSSVAGLAEVSITNATPETMAILIGPAPLAPVYANHNNSIALIHA